MNTLKVNQYGLDKWVIHLIESCTLKKTINEV